MQRLTEAKIINFLSQQAEASSQQIGDLASYLVERDSSVVRIAMESPLVIALATRSAMSGAIDYSYLTRLSTEDEVRRYFISGFINSTARIFPKYLGRKMSIGTREQSQDAHQDSERHHYKASTAPACLCYVV
jgi:hypothetical protein